MDAPKKREAVGGKRRAKIDDVIWYPSDRGAFCADVYNEKAGEVMLEAGPGPDGRFLAQAIGFLGITIWERRAFDSLNEAQIQIITWWTSVIYKPLPAKPAAPAKRRPGRPTRGGMAGTPAGTVARRTTPGPDQNPRAHDPRAQVNPAPPKTATPPITFDAPYSRRNADRK